MTLVDILADAYNTNDGTIKFATRASLPVKQLDQCGSPLDIWTDLLRRAQLSGKLAAVVDCAAKENVALEPSLRAAAEAYVRDTAANGSKPVRLVKQGLVALAELMDAPDVRHAVAQFRTRFEDARRGIEVVSGYKNVHDQLHELQFRCHAFVAQAARRVGSGEVEWDALETPLVELDHVLGQLAAIAAQGCVPDLELGWVADLRKARAALEAALRGRNAALLDEANLRMTRIVRVRPTQINSSLTRTANDLPLRDLAEALSQISGGLAGPGIEPMRVREFARGAEALSKLAADLAAMIAEHGGWQSVEPELHLLEDMLGHAPRAVAGFWREIKERVAELYGPVPAGGAAPPDPMTASLAECGERVDAALAAANPAQIQRAFLSYRHRVAERFFVVDLSLQRLCGELRMVGEPLAAVLRVLE